MKNKTVNIIIILLAVIIGVGGYFGYCFFSAAKTEEAITSIIADTEATYYCHDTDMTLCVQNKSIVLKYTDQYNEHIITRVNYLSNSPMPVYISFGEIGGETIGGYLAVSSDKSTITIKLKKNNAFPFNSNAKLKFVKQKAAS